VIPAHERDLALLEMVGRNESYIARADIRRAAESPENAAGVYDYGRGLRSNGETKCSLCGVTRTVGTRPSFRAKKGPRSYQK